MQRVLVVDDLADNLYYLEVLLRGNGFEARTAGNGAAALESARNDPPDLIIADILMPVMDGYTLCRECKADERLRRIPFIFYTATYTEQKDQALALSLGADRFIIKPQEPEALIAAIRETLAGFRSDEPRAGGDEPHKEEELLKEYSGVLFRKLEKKMAELEQTNRELEQKIGEQKRTEEQLRQAQKMEAVGRFSAGIAHDFNNILTVIIGYAYMIQMQLPDDEQLRSNMDQIMAATERAKNLTRSLLVFSKKQELRLEPLNLNDSIRNVENFLHRIIGEDIKLRLDLAEERIWIIADCRHIEQVLMNLATNARDAMPDGGIFSIGTDVIDMDDAFITMHGYGAPGRYAVVTVADSGAGMDEATRQRVFEPFFTTKEAGHGTGLGLAIIYGIVRQHNGYITVYSEPGHGTTFNMYLPLMQGDASRACEGVCARQIPRGSETLLVVDDEEPIRNFLELFLTGLGYRVLFAADGQEAIDVFRENMFEIDLVLMDVIMPNKNGREAAVEIRNMRSDIKIIFTSGYPYDLVYGRKLLDDGELLVMKPLTPTELAVRIRAALDGETIT